MSNAVIHFSILIPVYKTEQYLDRCMQSVWMQNYPNYTVVLVDDGSPDQCPQMCDEYAKQDSRICVIHKNNGGLMSARRVAINYVLDTYGKKKNHYILFLDSDDSLKQDALNVIARHIGRTQCDLLMFDADMTYQGEVLGHICFGREDIVEDKGEMLRRIASEQCNALWRKAVCSTLFGRLDYTDLYHIKIGEDIVQSLDLVQNATRMCFVADRLYNYEQSPNSMIRTMYASSYKPKSAFRKIVYDFLMEQAAWTEENQDWYYKKTQGFIAAEAREIGYMVSNGAERNQLWKTVRTDSYYCNFLKACKGIRTVDAITLFLLRRKLFSVLAFVCKASAKIRRLNG